MPAETINYTEQWFGYPTAGEQYWPTDNFTAITTVYDIYHLPLVGGVYPTMYSQGVTIEVDYDAAMREECYKEAVADSDFGFLYYQISDLHNVYFGVKALNDGVLNPGNVGDLEALWNLPLSGDILAYASRFNIDTFHEAKCKEGYNNPDTFDEIYNMTAISGQSSESGVQTKPTQAFVSKTSYITSFSPSVNYPGSPPLVQLLPNWLKATMSGTLTSTLTVTPHSFIGGSQVMDWMQG